jgi:hypothetical protein
MMAVSVICTLCHGAHPDGHVPGCENAPKEYIRQTWTKEQLEDEINRLQRLVSRKNDVPHLGLASTGDLIDELRARCQINGTADYRPADRRTPSEVTGTLLYRLARAIHEEEDQTRAFEHLGPSEARSLFERAGEMIFVSRGRLSVLDETAEVQYKGRKI